MKRLIRLLKIWWSNLNSDLDYDKSVDAYRDSYTIDD